MLTLALSEPQRLTFFLYLLVLRATQTISVSFYGWSCSVLLNLVWLCICTIYHSACKKMKYVLCKKIYLIVVVKALLTKHNSTHSSSSYAFPTVISICNTAWKLLCNLVDGVLSEHHLHVGLRQWLLVVEVVEYEAIAKMFKAFLTVNK